MQPKFGFVALLSLSVAGCASWCGCQNDAQHQQHSNNMPERVDAQSSTMDDGASSSAVGTDGTIISSQPYKEAQPVGTDHRPDQLAQVAADPNAKPFLTPPARPMLQRRTLPSEMQQAPAPMMPMSTFPQLIHSKKQLTDYAEQLGFQLAAFDAIKGAKVGVTSFVEFDDSLQQSNPLGNQFAEALVSTLPSYGVAVVDYKLTRQIKITRDGDFALSRDIRELSKKSGMDYILTGTLITTKRGVQIHSRVVSVDGQQVVASASTLLPQLVLQQIQP